MTDENGEILIENLPRGKTYTVTELSNPNYGYTVMASGSKKRVTRGKAVVLILDNEKQTGNLQINKVDKDTNKPLEGISFKLQSTTRGYVKAYTGDPATYQSQLVGENRLTNLTYTSDINQATEFITNEDGIIGIYNILMDTPYYVHETSVGKNSQYEIDDNYIDWTYTSTNATNNKSGTGHTVTITIVRQTSINTNAVNTVHDTLTVRNRKKYINLSGFVWEDLQHIEKSDDEKIDFNGIYDRDNPNNPDKLVEGIKVTLTDEKGNPVLLKEDSSGNTQSNPKTTDPNGEYRFEFVEIEMLNKYYITFEYNGMSYTNVKPPLTKDKEGNEIPDASKATEGDNRTTFNENYQTITYEEQNGKVQGISENGNDKVYNINYDTTSTSHESKLIYKTDANGREDKSNYNYGYEGNEASDPFSGVDEQYYILSDTRNAYEGQCLNAIKSEQEIREQGIEEIDNINLGLQKRMQVDLSLIKDINSVKVSINGAEHIYQYADRFKPELYESIDTYDKEGNKITNGYDITPQVKYGSKYGNMSYTRALYPSDIHYKENENDKLKVEITYKIGIRNSKTNKETDVTTTINELTDYYSNKYQKIKVGTQLNEDGTVKEDISVTPKGEIGNYTKVSIQPNLEIKGENSIYVQLEVKPEEIVNILGNDEDTIDLYNQIEITSYSSKDKDGKIYAAIDKDSQPGNLNVNDESTYEDDSDKAPGLKLVLQEEREVSGVVFVDATTRELRTGEVRIGEVRQGNGVYKKDQNDNDIPIEGVNVRLVKANSNANETANIYDKNEKTWKKAEITTLENGTYSIKGFVPDDYYIEFTWGGQKYRKDANSDELTKIRVQEYKSTIVNENVYSQKSENSFPEWYKDEFKKNYGGIEWDIEKSVSYYDEFGQNTTKQGAEIRVSDALDDYDIRQKIDNQSNNITNRTKNIIDVYDPESQLGNDNLITTMTSNTPKFKVNVEYFKDLTNSKEEYQVNPETGEVVTEGNYAVKREGYKNHLASIDFGIVERARQVLKLEKEVKHIKITLANGNVIIDADVINNQLEGQTKHVVYIPESATNAQIKCEIDNELIQGSNLEITYGLKVTNMSELDYNSEQYYYYGEGHDDIDNKLITLNPKQVIDYLDNNISTVNSNIDELGEIRQAREDKKQLIDKGLLVEEMEKLLNNTNRVLIIKALLGDLKPIKGESKGEYTDVTLIASKELTNTAVQDGITLDNSAEIIQVEKSGGAPVITMPGDYVASNSNQSSGLDDGDRAESVIITPPTGLSTNHIAYVILAISSLGILISGIILIKKFVLK